MQTTFLNNHACTYRNNERIFHCVQMTENIFTHSPSSRNQHVYLCQIRYNQFVCLELERLRDPGQAPECSAFISPQHIDKTNFYFTMHTQATTQTLSTKHKR